MERLTATTKVPDDGALEVSVPSTYKGATVEVTVAIKDKPDLGPRDANGWPIGFFEKFVGCIQDPKFVRPPQGVMEPVPPFE
jgi:hypothetical protein